MEIHSKTLPNGLQVVHADVPDTQMVALSILYNVGARNESPDHTGWAHLLEHLMFEGTPRVPDYDTRVQFCGGENNAFTNNDFTSFYITVPREHAETAFFLEADRMRGISLDRRSVQVQKQVVIEEFKQRYLSQPYGDVQHLIRALAYRVHPYRWPTIGIAPSHIESATPAALRTFYHRYYRPSNAILAVAGALPWEETLRLAEKHFANLQSSFFNFQSSIPSDPEPPQQRLRRKTVRREVPLDMIVMAWHMPSHSSPHYYVCDVITDLLAAGQSGRLAQHLVSEQKLFGSIDAYISGSLDPGLILIEGRLNPDVTLPQAEAAILTETDRLKHELVSDYELDKVRNRFESDRVWAAINPVNVAVNLAQQTLYGTTPDEDIRRYRAVTADDIRSTARMLLTRRNCSILNVVHIS
ncbi:MAG: insulinase family protein [Bacteroidaceae bacterium]|nr:insulinase family protein [Bacteroidaceae bacterium]